MSELCPGGRRSDPGRASRAVRSRHRRHPSDPLSLGRRVRVALRARRFCCRNPRSIRRTFAGQSPELAAPHARRTGRLAEAEGWVSVALGGEAGAKRLRRLAIPASAGEATYAAVHALPRGKLRRELIACLRQGKPMRGRKPKGSDRRGKLCGMTNIRERPEDVAGRLAPGHWEGDLILGAGNSAAGTLVERATRLLLLVLMPTRKAEVAASAFAGALAAIPPSLRQALTYDQGKEMARHKDLAATTGTHIFFADPHSPWQRGANENNNGLLRQYFPKGMNLAALTQSDLETVAASLNDRPRKTLDYDTPQERFTSLLANLASPQHKPPGGVRSGT